MIYAISDVHGCYEQLKQRINQIKSELGKEGNRLILLGDYIDRGKDSYKVLSFIRSLQEEYGTDKIIALKGNHEEWFLEFLENHDDVWLAEDTNYNTSKTFLSEEENHILQDIVNKREANTYVYDCIKKNHKDLIQWLKKMPYYYETNTQIFVHAGVEEEIPEEEIEWCTLATPEYIFTGKFPPTTGKFFKDIIVGHTSVAVVSNNEHMTDIYYDGASHYYIDGSVETTGKLLCLAYDEKKKVYYQLDESGERKSI